jgi:hypothetical protein
VDHFVFTDAKRAIAGHFNEEIDRLTALGLLY